MLQDGARAPALGLQRFTEVQGTEISWIERGSGDNLLLLHGLNDSHRTWRLVAPLLSRHFRLLMPDLPGHGWSGRPEAPYTIPWFVDVLGAWMDAIGLQRTHVCGHSFGGGVAQALLLQQRSRVERLALLAAGGLGREVGLALRLATLPGFELLQTPLLMRLASVLALGLNRQSFGYPDWTEIQEVARMNGLPGTGRAFLLAVRSVVDIFGQVEQSSNWVEAVQDLPPVVLLWGERDPVIPLRHGQQATELFAGSRLVVFPGIGHHPHLEAPDHFAAELAEFLQEGRATNAREEDVAPERRERAAHG